VLLINEFALQGRQTRHLHQLPSEIFSVRSEPRPRFATSYHPRRHKDASSCHAHTNGTAKMCHVVVSGEAIRRVRANNQCSMLQLSGEMPIWPFFSYCADDLRQGRKCISASYLTWARFTIFQIDHICKFRSSAMHRL
jgi:hypothetical protein